MSSGMHQANIVRSSVTWREHEMLSCVAKGKANKDIADILCLSPRTVQSTYKPTHSSRPRFKVLLFRGAARRLDRGDGHQSPAALGPISPGKETP